MPRRESHARHLQGKLLAFINRASVPGKHMPINIPRVSSVVLVRESLALLVLGPVFGIES